MRAAPSFTPPRVQFNRLEASKVLSWEGFSRFARAAGCLGGAVQAGPYPPTRATPFHTASSSTSTLGASRSPSK